MRSLVCCAVAQRISRSRNAHHPVRKLPTQAGEALRPHHVRQARERLAAGNRRQVHGYVFASRPGRSLTPPTSGAHSSPSPRRPVSGRTGHP